MRAAKRKQLVEDEIRRWCEKDLHTLWIDARWYDELTHAEVQAIVSEYGYGPLRDSGTREVIAA